MPLLRSSCILDAASYKYFAPTEHDLGVAESLTIAFFAILAIFCGRSDAFQKWITTASDAHPLPEPIAKIPNGS
jgi:hypothetical protein